MEVLERRITQALILALFALAGGVVWGYFCQQTLRDWRISLRALLGLIVAVAVAIQLGLMVLEAAQFLPD